MYHVRQDFKDIEISGASHYKKVRQKHKVKEKSLPLTPVTHVEKYVDIRTGLTKRKNIFGVEKSK